jgi:hypothetical protein
MTMDRSIDACSGWGSEDSAPGMFEHAGRHHLSYSPRLR